MKNNAQLPVTRLFKLDQKLPALLVTISLTWRLPTIYVSAFTKPHPTLLATCHCHAAIYHAKLKE